jgi:predicted Zn-ribbon and HTH transcriptional regulator
MIIGKIKYWEKIMILSVNELKCKRCGHLWVNRTREVRICPRCKSPYWDREKTIIKKKDK